MTCQLQDIVIGIQTGPFGSQLHRSDYTETGTPVIMPQDIVDWKLSTEKIVRIPEEYVLRLQRHKVEYNDIIYPRRGDVGKCALVEKEVGWICGTGCLKVKVDPDKANPKYIFYYLQQSHIGKWIELHSTGATMMNINSSTLNTLPLDIPSLAVQNKIIAFISAYDELIENSRKQIALLEEAAQRLYREWFVDFRFPGSTSHDSLPQGWTEGVVKDVIAYEIGGGWGLDAKTVANSEEGYVIRSTDFAPLNSGVYNQLPCRFHTVNEINTRSLQIGDIIFEVSGGSKTEGVGKTYFISKEILSSLDKPVICASFCKLIRLKDTNHALYYFDTLQYWRYCGDISVYDKRSASNIVNFNWKGFLSQKKIIVPPSQILDEYMRLREPLIQQVRNLQNQLSKLAAARDKLLPKLMSGELKV
jgi:type I restriction enzyme S subunit